MVTNMTFAELIAKIKARHQEMIEKNGDAFITKLNEQKKVAKAPANINLQEKMKELAAKIKEQAVQNEDK